MKKIATLILFLAVTAAYAQSFQITYNGEPVGEELDFTATLADEDNELVLTVTNTSDQTNSIYLSKRVISEVPGSYNTFCFGMCYDPSITSSPVPLTLGPGESSDGGSFHLVYNPCGNEGTTEVNYTFTSNNFNVSLLVNYTYSETGINVSVLRVNSLTAYPNPATSNVTVAYDLSGCHTNSDARLVITNLVGSKMVVRPINGTSGNVSMDLTGLDAGIYFYSIEADGKIVSTKKLIVK